MCTELLLRPSLIFFARSSLESTSRNHKKEKTELKKIVILGAGISGLSLGWFLKDQNIIILEKGSRSGGWLESIDQDGFLFEQGPRSCRPSGAGTQTLQLIEELNLQDQVIVGNRNAKKRYLWSDAKLRRLNPLTLLLKPFLWKGIWKDLRSPRTVNEDESIYDFFSRRFGTEIAHKLIDPMATGIYAGDIRQLSLRSCFPSFWENEQKHGSLIRAAFTNKEKPNLSPFIQNMQKHSLFSFQNGMKTLTETLSSELKNKIQLNKEVKSLEFQSDGARILLSNGEEITADHVYSTLPANSLASIIPNPLSEKLKQFQNTSVSVVNLGYRKNVLPKQGFGYLIPSQEKEEILGVVWDSSAFPEQNRNSEETRLTVMIGGAHMQHFHDYSESDFIQMSLRAISKHLGIQKHPDSSAIKLAPDSIPQYQVGHFNQIRALEPLTPKRLTLLGTSFYGVAVNDCIAKAYQVANEESD